MTTRQRWRFGALGAYAALLAITISALGAFAARIDDRLGANYTAAASDIVRGQHEASVLYRASETFLRRPTRENQQRILRVLGTIESRAGITRDSFARLGLSDAARAEGVAEFEYVLGLLPRLRALTEVARTAPDPEIRLALRELAAEIENGLAYTYSTLHRLNHAASATQRRLVRLLSATVIGLTGLMLLIIGALLWSTHKMSTQRGMLQRLAVTDALTGLSNRRALVQRLEAALAERARNRQPVSLALMDIDHFKRINDQDGHPEGDRVLEELGRRLPALVRGGDTVARIGGEEFGVLMPDTDAGGAYALCERIRTNLASHSVLLPNDVPRLTVSIGVTTTRTDEPARFDALYTRADKALYKAKREGRNRVVHA